MQTRVASEFACCYCFPSEPWSAFPSRRPAAPWTQPAGLRLYVYMMWQDCAVRFVSLEAPAMARWAKLRARHTLDYILRYWAHACYRPDGAAAKRLKAEFEQRAAH